MSILGIIINPIINGVLKGLAEMRALKQFEEMQAEILEGWAFKIKIAVERAAKKHNVPYEAYEEIINSINEVVEEEFDTRRI
jgi:hypothetical protein